MRVPMSACVLWLRGGPRLRAFGAVGGGRFPGPAWCARLVAVFVSCRFAVPPCLSLPPPSLSYLFSSRRQAIADETAFRYPWLPSELFVFTQSADQQSLYDRVLRTRIRRRAVPKPLCLRGVLAAVVESCLLLFGAERPDGARGRRVAGAQRVPIEPPLVYRPNSALEVCLCRSSQESREQNVGLVFTRIVMGEARFTRCLLPQ